MSPLDLNAIPNPPNSPIEKLLPDTMWENIEPRIRDSLSENPTKDEILRAFSYYDRVLADYIQRHERQMTYWANIHTHPGVIGGGGVLPSGSLYIHSEDSIGGLQSHLVVYEDGTGWVDAADKEPLNNNVDVYFDPVDRLAYANHGSAVYPYDTDGDFWGSAVASMPESRRNAQIERVGGLLYYCFGVYLNSRRKTVLVYDIASDSWTTTGDLHPEFVLNTGGGVWSGRIYSLGGFAFAPIDNAGYIDPTGPSWTSIASVPQDQEPAASGALSDGRIVIAGGRDGVSSWTDKVWILDATTETWVSGAPVPEVLTNAIGCFNGGQLHIASLDNQKHYIYDMQGDVWSAGPDLPTPITGYAGMFADHGVDTSVF